MRGGWLAWRPFQPFRPSSFLGRTFSNRTHFRVGKILLYLHHLLAYHNLMLLPAQTPRQRMIELLIGTRLATHQLAQMLDIRERQVEEHLSHVVKTIARDKSRRFVLDPAFCQDCNFVFRDRRRLTSPSRCPQCRSEAVAAPRYGIDLSAS